MEILTEEELKDINGGAGTLTGLILGVVTNEAIDYCKEVTRHPEDYRDKRSSYCSSSLTTGQSL